MCGGQLLGEFDPVLVSRSRDRRERLERVRHGPHGGDIRGDRGEAAAAAIVVIGGQRVPERIVEHRVRDSTDWYARGLFE